VTVDEPVRVLVVDDDPLVRAGLAFMLGEFEDLQVVGQVEDGRDVPAAVARHRPDVVLMDIRMREVDGITATARLRERPGAPQVIVLTTFDTDGHIRRALRAGASGFLLKHAAPAEIARAVRAVAAGEPMLSPQVTRRVMAFAAAEPDPGRRDAARLLAGLTPAELAVARLVGTGSTNAEIAARLHLSPATVKAVMTRIMTKLDVGNRVQVALLIHAAGTDGDGA
jgi:DNA-binding NarL/FixJ family response regulator